MLKRPIKYTNFDDEEVTETFYFNISEPEMLELEHERKGGFAQWMREIVKMEDERVILEQFKRIILLAYGEKTADGKHFVKKDAEGRPLSAKFEASAAYIALYMEMISSEEAAAVFIRGVMPKRVVEEMAKEENKPEPADATPAQT